MQYDTAGNTIKEIIICTVCRQDTAGSHEWNCPNALHWGEKFGWRFANLKKGIRPNVRNTKL